MREGFFEKPFKISGFSQRKKPYGLLYVLAKKNRIKNPYFQECIVL
jgi:hypothetical protein